MKLSELLAGLARVEADPEITGLALDSRKLAAGNVFLAVNGHREHALAYADQVIANGACAIVYDTAGQGRELAARIQGVPVIALAGLADKLSLIAARFYGDPSQNIAVIGITGTNGKTSCSQFLAQALGNCGIIGTLGWGDWGNLSETANTTPDAVSVQAILAGMLARNKQAVAMEVSSHSLVQGRVNAVRFKGAVFTNLSRDHLDYHETMHDYLNAKRRLFQMPGLEFAVVNLDNEYSEGILTAIPQTVSVWAVSTGEKALAVKGHRLTAGAIKHNPEGISFIASLDNGESRSVSLPVYGDFNIENILSVIAVLLAMGLPLAEAAQRLEKVSPVIGRMQRISNDRSLLIFIDYAHSPDALEKVLSSARKHCQGELWAVFGCGGNRDAGKRSQMGAVADQLADRIVITDDNPRYENAEAITGAIVSGCRSKKAEIIHNRREAIRKAIHSAKPGDCLVIAGKGHEQYQEINGEKLPFSDVEAVQSALTMEAA